MITDGKRHPLDFFEDNYYDIIEVSQEDYAELSKKGLYRRQDKVFIAPGMKKIKFRYYSPDDKLIEADSVPVMYDGEKGVNGDRGAMYRGVGNSDSVIENPVENDFYLNTTDGAIHKYQDGKWNIITDPAEAYSEYNMALQDGVDYYTSMPDTAPVVKAFNVWAKNVFALNAVIENIFTHGINIKENGYVKSNNWETGIRGFKLDSEGIEVNNGTFRGAIESGPLILNNTTPPGATINSYTSESVKDYYDRLRVNGIMDGTHNCSGTLNGNNVSIIKLNYSSSESYTDFFEYERFYNSFDEYDLYTGKIITEKWTISINNNMVYESTKTQYIKISYISAHYYKPGTRPAGIISDNNNIVVGDKITSDGALSFNVSGYTMILKQLPSSGLASFAKGTVYEENGYLRIKT